MVAVLALVAGLAPVSVWEAMADDPPDDGGTRTVRFYWSEEVCTQALAEAWGLADCEEFDQEDLWGHPAWIADGGLRVFDADGQPVTGVDHGYAADSAVTLDQVNSRARGRAFELVPGWYGWEGWGHQGRRVGGGVFEVPAGEGPLELFISQAQIVLSPSSPASKIELWDYLGNPVEPALTWDGYMPSATYAVLARQAGEFYDAVDNPTDVGQAYSYRVTPVDQTAASAKSGLLYWPEIAWPAVDAPNNAFRNAFRDTYDWTRSQVRFVDGKWYRSTGGEGYAYLSLAVPHRFEVAVTAGARFRVFEKGPRHFEAFTEHLPVSGPVRDEDGLYDRYVFMLPDSVHVHYEAGGGEWLREAQSFQVRPDVSVYRVTVDLEALDNHPAEPFDPGTQGTPSAGQLESGLLLNLDDSQHLSLDVGGSFDLFPIRVWQAMEGTTGNYFVEPDYHLELVDFAGETDRLDSFDGGSAEVSAVSLTPVGAPGRQEYRVTGLSEGTALIRITYDAVAWRPSHATPDPDLSSQPGGQRTYLGPTEPRSAGLVVVTVGAADSSGISLGLAESGE
ncbi:MAG: hypothetical protein LBK54_11050, partial [Propionibacteriaceae bacterium]|nr:hypothetical protein [Propionibacteriaceae bacterium]